MKKIGILGLLVCLLITSFLWASCSDTITLTSTSTPQSPATTTKQPTSTASSTTQANWWDTLGKPQYGGTINWPVTSLPTDFDPYTSWGGVVNYYLETMWTVDWKLDRDIWGYKTIFIPPEYWAGNLAASWEWPDAQTIIVHLREGIYWQNKPPVNGREFTAEDVQHHYDRMLGIGSGYTAPSPMNARRMGIIEKVTATDKYTVTIKFTKPSAIAFLTVSELASQNFIEAPEAVKAEGGLLMDWHNAIGTGPWIVADYVAGAEVDLDRNPNYWGVDERHPQNQLPYADKFKVINIPDQATSLAALRTGKIDLLYELTMDAAANLSKTNPELMQSVLPKSGQGADIRIDKAPFDNINVRKALNMALDRPTIARGYFDGSVDGTPAGIISPSFTGYSYSYDQWPQSLKDEYSYNPTGAKKLLADAGFAQGFKTNVVAASNSDVGLMEIIKSQLNDIGVDMEIQLMDPAAFMDYSNARKYDALCWNSPGNSGSPSPIQIMLNLHYTGDMGNYAMVSDPAYDAIVDKFNAATTLEEVKSLCMKADKYAIEQHWALLTFPIVFINAYQAYLKGYTGESVSGGGSNPVPNWSRWWVDQSLKTSIGH
jgi:peptide/nickel transport system substrate-binding protein